MVEKTVQGYEKAKSNVIEYISQKYCKETGSRFASSLKGGEQVLSEKMAKMAPTDEQTHALKFAELLGLGKLAKDVFKEGVKQTFKKIETKKPEVQTQNKPTQFEVNSPLINHYEEAMNGGKHSGWAKQYAQKPDDDIKRGIKSLEKQILEHQDKIKDPEKYYPNFRDLRIEEQRANIEKIWPRDIAKQKEQKYILEKILEKRSNLEV